MKTKTSYMYIIEKDNISVLSDILKEFNVPTSQVRFNALHLVRDTESDKGRIIGLDTSYNKLKEYHPDFEINLVNFEQFKIELFKYKLES